VPEISMQIGGFCPTCMKKRKDTKIYHRMMINFSIFPTK
jgi:hypothetical protein